MARLEAGLAGLAGQEKAANKIKAALFRHTWDRPLAFHFAGESGVGKTSTAQLLARALYADEDLNDDGRPPPGLLVLDGEYFDSKASDKIEEYRDHITREVISQLQRCPRSIIVFDELELVDPRTLAILEPFLDKRFISYQGQSANAGQAIFIFISNAAALDSALTDQEAESAMRASLAKAWGGRKKIGSLVQNMVPFQRLDEVALREVMRARLEGLVDVYGQREGLRRVCYSHRVLAALVAEVLRLHPRTNARGVDLVFNPKVVEPLLTHLQKLRERAQLDETQRKDMLRATEDEDEAKHETEEEGGGGGGTKSRLESMWWQAARPLGSLSARISRSSSRATSFLSRMLFDAHKGEWRGEFEASLYFHKGNSIVREELVVLELKELTTGSSVRVDASQLTLDTAGRDEL